MKKFLSLLLSILMIVSCIGTFSASAETPDSIQIAITTCGAKDQRCTFTNTTDTLGRPVQKIIPDDSSKPTSNMAPAYFSDSGAVNTFTGGSYTKADRQDFGFKAVKLVVYVSKTSTSTPALSCFNSGYASNNASLVSGGPLQGGKWNTLIYDISGCTNITAETPLYAYMFKPFNAEAVSNHVGEEIYIGYTGLFKSVDLAKAHVSAFEVEEKPSELPAITLNASWASPKDQRCNKETVTDEFGRTYPKFNAVHQYFDGGSDLTAKGTVSPGGSVGTPADVDKYTIAKLVYRSTDTFVPTFYSVASGFSKTYTAQPIGSTDNTANKWHTVYFNFKDLGTAINMFMVNFSGDDVANHTGDSYEIGYLGLFPSMVNAQAHVSDFEGDLKISDIRLAGISIGTTVPAEGFDLQGYAEVPALTVKAVGNTNDVKVVNGTLDGDGKAVSYVMNGKDAVVTVNFFGGSDEFKITGILVNGKPLSGFAADTATYDVVLPFGSGKPTVSYTYQGKEETVIVNTTTEGEGYKSEISVGGKLAYTVSFTVSTVKPEGLLHTLAMLKSGEAFTVGYFGGSVTSGTGSSSSNNYSWRALTREWLKSNFPGANITERNAAIGGTGSVFGVFRADKQFIKDKAPDLCFIEMCVNDTYDSYGTPNGSEVNAYSSGNYVTFAESIIRKIYASNPKADIIIVITEDNGKMRSENYSKDVPSFGAGYTALGEYYNIPVIYVSHELGKVILAENGGKVFPSTGDAAWSKYFGTDSVHPNDTGYAFYASVLNKFLDENLPKSYTPTAEDDADKVLPASNYSKSPLLIDAYMVTPNELRDTEGKAISNGHGSLGGMTLSESLTSAKAGQSATFLFKASTFGLWTWSYGTNNGINGTNIKVSVDGGTEKTVNLYRSYPNHKVYILAEGLDPNTVHSIKITHADANATMDIRQFFLAGVTDTASKGVFVAPIIGGKDITVAVKHANGDPMDFAFDPAVYEYTLPVTDDELAVGYPIVTVTTATGSGFVVENATPTTRRALITLDSKEVYTINFANDNIPDGYTVEKASKAFGDDARIVFEEATEKDIQIKKDGEGWDNAQLIKAGATEISALSAGLYQLRFVIAEGNYGMPVDVIVPTTFPENANVFYVSDSGNGDGLTPENPAALGTKISNAVSGYKSAFKSDYTTKDAYIVLVGKCTHSTNAALDFTGIPNITFMAQPGAVLNLVTHINHTNKTIPVNVTWKDIDIILGNPAKDTQSGMDGEIYYNAFGNNVLFDNVSIIGYATNETLGITRTKGVYLHSFGDGGGTYTAPNKGTITVNSPNLKVEQTRSSGYGVCEVSGNASYVANDGNFVQFGIGGHGGSAYNIGGNRGVINGGTFGNIYVGPASSGTIKGSAAIIINGIGSLSGKIQAKTTTTKDTVLILNNGLADTYYSKVATANIDYIIKSGIGGSADVEFAGADGTEKTAGKFVFTTDRPSVKIDGTIHAVEDGSYTVSAADLGTGVHTVEYMAAPSEIAISVSGAVGILRDSADAPSEGKYAKVAIASADFSEIYGTKEIETAETRTSGGSFAYDAEFTLNSASVSKFVIAIAKPGYVTAVSSTFNLNNLKNGDELSFSADLVGGDIADSYENVYGNGTVDVNDFIKVVRAFRPEASTDLRICTDINEDEVITVADLAIVKAALPCVREPYFVRAVKTNNVSADFGGGIDHSDARVDEGTGIIYTHITPKADVPKGSVHLDCWGLPKIDVTGGSFVVKALVRTNYSNAVPFVNCYNIYNADGQNITSSMGGITGSADAKLKADGNWEEYYVVVSGFEGTAAAYSTQIHLKTWGSSANAGNVPADAYYDVACWAAFSDMYSAEHTDLKKFCK